MPVTCSYKYHGVGETERHSHHTSGVRRAKATGHCFLHVREMTSVPRTVCYPHDAVRSQWTLVVSSGESFGPGGLPLGKLWFV